MAHTDNIPLEALQDVARQIADLVERKIETRLQVENALPMDEGTSARQTPLKFGDSFRICKLKANALQSIRDSKAEGDLYNWVVQSDQYFHQIMLNDEPKAFARSTFPLRELNEESLDQLNVSSLPQLIEQASEKIKQNKENDPVVANDPVVRFLEIPSYHLIALWLYGETKRGDETARESRVLTVLAPQRYKKLNTDHFLTTTEFFDALREQPPLEGIA